MRLGIIISLEPTASFHRPIGEGQLHVNEVRPELATKLYRDGGLAVRLLLREALPSIKDGVSLSSGPRAPCRVPSLDSHPGVCDPH